MFLRDAGFRITSTDVMLMLRYIHIVQLLYFSATVKMHA